MRNQQSSIRDWGFTRVPVLLIVVAFWCEHRLTKVRGQEADSTPLRAAIGADLSNLPDDVRWLQSTLNQIPVNAGGPQVALEIDGIFGPLTKSALLRFEKIQLDTRLGQVEFQNPLGKRLVEFQQFSEKSRAGEAIAWGAAVTAEFRAAVIEISADLELDPNHLMAAIAFETAETFSPAIKNAAGSGATGLIQFMPQTAKSLGTSTDELKTMSAVAQLAYVHRYFEPFRGKCQTVSDVYMAILWPRAVGKPEDFVLFEKGAQNKTYQMNRGLDRNGDGQITKAEAAELVTGKLKKGLREEFKR